MKKLLTYLFFFCCCTTQAQYKKTYFNTLDVKSGLPEAVIKTTLEDKNGYLWMGTQSGLVRYDGYQFKSYPMRNKAGNIISPNSIQRLTQDSKGKIWAFTRETGIHYYNPQTDQFVLALPVDTKTFEAISQSYLSLVDDGANNAQWLLLQNFTTLKTSIFKFNTANYTLQEYNAITIENHQLSIHEPRSVIKDASGKIWLAADSLLSYFDETTQTFKHYFTLPKSLNDSLIYQLIADPIDANILWINTYTGYQSKIFDATLLGKNVLRFNIKTKTFQRLTPDANNASAIPANCMRILTDSLQRLWVATEKGISLYNAAQNGFTNFTIEFNRKAPVVTTICADKTKNLWIGGNFKNLYYLNLRSGLSQQIEKNTYEGSLPAFGNGINKIFYDKSGTLWVSMPWYGIARFEQQKTLFAPSLLSPTNSAITGNTNRSSLKIKGTQGDSICFVADTANLYAWHSLNNQFSRIDLKSKDAYKSIRAVVTAKNGSLWIATSGVGLFNYNPITKAVKKWENKPNDSLSLISNYINSLAIDNEGVIWIGTSGKGLSSYNPHTDRFVNYPFILNNNYNVPENALDDDEVSSIMITSDGIIWIGTNNGALNSFNPKTAKFKSYLDKDKGFFCVVSLLEDRKKRIWAGTYLSGLFLIDPQAGVIKRYNENDGLLYNGIFNLTEDNSGNIWCSSFRGYSRLNPANNSIANFPVLPKVVNGTDLGFLYKDSQGTIYQSYKDGLVSFNPSDLKPNVIIPSVIIESIKYRAAKTNRDTILYTQANQNIILSYNENKIEFEYVALHFVNAENNKYAYQLIGYDKDWVQAGTQRSATYTNLSPGTYQFKVKACNSDGVWNETGASIAIKILPPWWRTWWAYLLYSILFILFLGGYISLRSRKLKKENALLEEKIVHRTSMLQKSLEDLKSTQSQLIQSEKMASLGELTAGIAHEIQNPLNFVNNFSEVSNELIDEMNEELNKGNNEEAKAIALDIKQNLEKVAHHGKRADSIVKGMLQHSRASSGQKEPTDINALADEYLRLAYHGLRAKDKSFNATLKTDFDETIGNINIIPQDMGRVILNLFTNAFYVVDEKKKASIKSAGQTYEPTVTVTTKRLSSPSGDGGKVLISVKDNGNGVPQSVIDKIFQPFFTTKPTGQGTGLGLSMSYDIIKAHGGELKVETKEGEFAEFVITLPV